MTDEPSPPSNETLRSQYDEYVMPIWKQLNVPVKRAAGCTLEDFEGNEYLDVFSGIAVTNTGHRNEAVVEAAREQLDNLVHSCSYVHPNQPVAALAERLAALTPGDLQKSFFCNSGTEAVEGAIKLARKYTGSTEIVALEQSFHGRTLGSLALTGNSRYKHGMAPTINDVTHARAPYSYRCPRCDDDCTACAENVAQVIDSHTSDDVAAIVVEPVMGEGGIIVPSDDWMTRVREIANERGALLIFDEVQTGYGRTGELWAADHFDVTPDIITQAKGIASGLPLGAFTASAEVADAFEAGDHLSTFGGNPVASAAALATVEELQDGLIANARERGDRLASRLATLESQFDVVGDVRGLGLMQGVELVDPDRAGPNGVAAAPDPALATSVVEHLREQGIIMGLGGYNRNVLRFQPPLTITAAQLDEAVAELETAVKVNTA